MMYVDENIIRLFCSHIVGRARSRGFDNPLLGYFAVLKEGGIDGYGFIEDKGQNECFIAQQSPDFLDFSRICLGNEIHCILIHIDTENDVACLRFYTKDEMLSWLHKEHYYSTCHQYYRRWVADCFPGSHMVTLGTI